VSSQNESAQERLHHLESHHAGRVAAFRQRLAQVGYERTLVVLLDIGKNVHWLTALTAASRELIRPRKLPATQTGLNRFFELVEPLIHSPDFDLVLLGHEPTGVYHEPWARTFMDRYAAYFEQARPQIKYVFFNPYQVKLARLQTHLRHRKTDPRDLAAMFDLMTRGLGHPAFLPTGVEMLVRNEVGFIRAQSRLLGRLERQLLQQLDRLWPGAVVNVAKFSRAHPELGHPTPIIQTNPLQRDRLRVLLQHCPNPYDLRAMPAQEILALYRQHVGRAGPALLNTLRTWADNAVLLPEDVCAPLAQQVRRLFAQYVGTETLIEDGHGRLVPLIPLTPARHISAIHGLSVNDAARYLAGVGAARRFHRAAEVWALAGWDPITDGSGDKPDRVGHISKHGDPAFRNALYQMGYRTALHYAPIGLTFLNAVDRGRSEVEATIHAAHRVNRICFHLLNNDEPFQSQSTPKLEAERECRWKLFQAAKKRRRNRRKRSKRRR
jgi:transposase